MALDLASVLAQLGIGDRVEQESSFHKAFFRLGES